MAILDSIVHLPNLAWLKASEPLSVAETKQRENESEYSLPNAHYPLDVPASTEMAHTLWALLEPAETR